MSPLGPPRQDLTGFPVRELLPEQPLYRIHRHGREPWWCSDDGSARFDLAAPRGTCYLAEGSLGAFVEVFRTTVVVPEAEVTARRLSTLYVPYPLTVADCTARRARAFGITAAIHSGEDYQLTQAWADAFAAASFGGVRYLVSHDPSQRLAGIALFGRAGVAAWPVGSTEPIASVLLLGARRAFGLRVVPAR